MYTTTKRYNCNNKKHLYLRTVTTSVHGEELWKLDESCMLPFIAKNVITIGNV